MVSKTEHSVVVDVVASKKYRSLFCLFCFCDVTQELVGILKPRMLAVRKDIFPDAPPFEENGMARLPESSSQRVAKLRMFIE
jgi:hypothetical protein